MILRPNYIEELKPFIDKEQVKVITGIRRSGKSTILLLLRKELLDRGVNESQIIHLNFESFQLIDYRNDHKLYAYIKGKISNSKKYYLLLDEIQEVVGWERVINSFLVDFEVDIYLTGSNAHLLSSELATYLAGRYIEIGRASCRERVVIWDVVGAV